VLVSCAAGSHTTEQVVTDTYVPAVVQLSASDSSAFHLGQNGSATVLPVPLGLAWAVLDSVYRGFDLEVTQVDPVGHAIAGKRDRSRRSFGGKSFGALLDCGETAGIPNASRFEITIQVATALRARGNDSTLVASWALATAKPSTTAGDLAPCVSNGEIPVMIDRAILRAAQ
jgi:hypothetical protein